MNLLTATLVAFLLSCSMAVDPQVVVMIVLKTADNAFTCANREPLFERLSRANTEGKPVVNQISCPQVAEDFYEDYRYVLLQLDFDANTFQRYTFRQKKTSEQVVKLILEPLLLAGEEVEVYSVQEPATISEYSFMLDGYALNRGGRRNWGLTFVKNATLVLGVINGILDQVKASFQTSSSLSSAYGFQLAYYYPMDGILKCVVRFKNLQIATASEIQNLLQPYPSVFYNIDKNDISVNVVSGNWIRPVLEPQVVVIVVLKTLDLALTCNDLTTLYNRFTGTTENSQGTPVVNQVTCPKDAIETVGESRYVLLQMNFDANIMEAYASRHNKNIEEVVNSILTPRLLIGEDVQVVSVYQPQFTPDYFIQIDAIVTLNGASDRWQSDFWPNVQSFMQRYNELLQNVESNIRDGPISSGASQFKFAYFYKEFGRTRAVMWFKNTNFITEDEIKNIINQNPLTTYQLFTTNLVANVIEVNGNRPIIDTPEDFGHFADFWLTYW